MKTINDDGFNQPDKPFSEVLFIYQNKLTFSFNSKNCYIQTFKNSNIIRHDINNQRIVWIRHK